MPDYHVRQYKSILNVRKWIDSWFWERYSINPYNGCSFGCIYCDARSNKYHMPLDFETQITVKDRAGEMLDQRISRARKLLPDIVGMSGVTDPYQPAEHKYRITRSCLEVLEKHQWPVHIITKSKLVLEDLELLNRIGMQSWANVSVTLSTVNKKYARFLDKYAPDPEIRLEVIRQFKEKAPHVQVGVLVMPVIPGLGDQPEEMQKTIEAIRAAGADYVLFAAGLTLRDTQAHWFLTHLEKEFPEMIPGYMQIYRGKWEGGEYSGDYGPIEKYSRVKNGLLYKYCQEAGIPMRMQRYLPEDYRRNNYLLSQAIFDEAWTRKVTGAEVSRTWQFTAAETQMSDRDLTDAFLNPTDNLWKGKPTELVQFAMKWWASHRN